MPDESPACSARTVLSTRPALIFSLPWTFPATTTRAPTHLLRPGRRHGSVVRSHRLSPPHSTPVPSTPCDLRAFFLLSTLAGGALQSWNGAASVVRLERSPRPRSEGVKTPTSRKESKGQGSREGVGSGGHEPRRHDDGTLRQGKCRSGIRRCDKRDEAG